MHFGCVEFVEQHCSTRSTQRARLARHARLDALVTTSSSGLTHRTCRAHAIWLCRACRTARLDTLDTSNVWCRQVTCQMKFGLNTVMLLTMKRCKLFDSGEVGEFIIFWIKFPQEESWGNLTPKIIEIGSFSPSYSKYKRGFLDIVYHSDCLSQKVRPDWFDKLRTKLHLRLRVKLKSTSIFMSSRWSNWCDDLNPTPCF